LIPPQQPPDNPVGKCHTCYFKSAECMHVLHRPEP
jgi:hypothetical protein